jgi:hypothetical protein
VAPAVIPRALIQKFQIPKGVGVEPLWCRVLMNGVRQRYQREDYSLVTGEYKMWGDEALSTITVKKIDGDEALIFTFNETTGLLASVKDQSGADVSLTTLKEGEGWNVVLTQFANEILKERGVEVEGATIKVHPKALKKFPGDILERLTPSVTNVRYLNDDFEPNPAIDAGGVSRQFTSDLCKALFITTGEDPPLIVLTEEDSLPDFKDEEAAIYQKFGNILSFVLTNTSPLITGVYLNPKFYLLLKKAALGLTPDQIAVSFTKEILTQDPDTIKTLNFYDNPSPELKLEAITCLRNTYLSDLTDEATIEDVRREIETTILERGIKMSDAILHILNGMSPLAKANLATIEDADLSTRIQGSLVTAESLKAAIQMEEGLSDLALEKRTWILERIDEKQEDPKWLAGFLHFITGQPFLSPLAPPIKLKFLDLENFNAHTCFNMLDVPINVAKREEFLAALDICIQDPTSFTTA